MQYFLSQTVKRTRFAPTPSGFLHMGNVFNLIFCCLISKIYETELWLRIDDLDQERTRNEYIEDIFETIDWLGVKFDKGPSGLEDFQNAWSQQHRMPQYLMKKKFLINNNLVFACECSRKEIGTDFNEYNGKCLQKNLPLSGDYSLRSKPVDYNLKINQINPNHLTFSEWNIFENYSKMIQLFKKDNHPSYQLASLSDDCEMGMTHIVRGNDLFASTQMQVYLSNLLGIESFKDTVFLHHDLLLDSNQEKLSKSILKKSNQKLRNELSKRELFKKFSLFFLKEEVIVETLEQLIDCVISKLVSS
ncbi:MAG: glutamate--tRNA ligase family protein [Cytophagales bacterium]